MAATRTKSQSTKKAAPKRATASGSKSNGKAARGRAGGTARSRAGSTSRTGSKSSSRGSTRAAATSAGKRSGETRSAARSAESKGNGASLPSSEEVGEFLKKARTPAAVAGAALIGVAGGAALAHNGRRRWTPRRMISPSLLDKGMHGIEGHLPGRSGPVSNLKKGLKQVSLPSLDPSMIEWVEEKARAVGRGGYQVAELSAQARKLQQKMSD